MACCSTPEVGSKEDFLKSKEIDRVIKTTQKDNDRKFKFLLLGTGDSGKSTFLKQMKIINNKPFPKPEVERFGRILKDNALKSIKVLIEQALINEDHKLPSKLKKHAKVVMESVDLTESIIKPIKILWESKIFQKIWDERGGSFQIHSTADYFLDNCDRFVKESFEPNNDDILRARVRTSGIVETLFEIDNRMLNIIDIGGQRSERRKWIHCFEDVFAIIYLAALDEYDMVLEEDHRANRMLESIKLFGEVSSSQWFKNTLIILFLNKTDTFQEKIKRSPLKQLFPDYTGGTDKNLAIEYIESQYSKAYAGNKKIYVRHTCALDTGNIQHIFLSIKETIFGSAMDMFV